MGVIEFLCDRRFHQTITLPPNPDTGREKPLKVSYSDYGDRDSDAVVLFCGPLMGVRFSNSPLDQLAKKYRVRIIHADRPGIGGSDPVQLHERVSTWLEMVPQLLAHLHISHVSVASHSGGVIYALNTILMYPNLLHPQNPYVCFFAPWVHHSHTGVGQMRAAGFLPASMVGKFASTARFFHENVLPVAGLSGGLLQGTKAMLSSSTPAAAPVPLAPCAPHSQDTPEIASREVQGQSGLDLNDPQVVEELKKLIVTYLFAERIDGISADAQLFLKNPRSVSWCSPSMMWSDIDYFVPLLSKTIEEEGQYGMGSRRWMFDAFHAEEDHMVGEKGRQWFDSCWTPKPPSTADDSNETNTPAEQQRSKSFEYRSEIVIGGDHDFLMDPAFGATAKWLERVRASFPGLKEVKLENVSLTSIRPIAKPRKKAQLTRVARRAKNGVRKFSWPWAKSMTVHSTGSSSSSWRADEPRVVLKQLQSGV